MAEVNKIIDSTIKILEDASYMGYDPYDLQSSFFPINNLPKNSTYFDPVKALVNRECGIHLQ